MIKSLENSTPEIKHPCE